MLGAVSKCMSDNKEILLALKPPIATQVFIVWVP